MGNGFKSSGRLVEDEESVGKEYELENLIKCKVGSSGSDASRTRANPSNILPHSKKTRDKSSEGCGLCWSFTMLMHIFSISFVAFILYKCIPGAVFFSIHPICMSISYGFLMFEAVMFFSSRPLFSVQKRASKVTLHWIFQMATLLIAIIGFLVAVYQKILKNKDHFVSWHSWFGLAAYIFTFLNSVGGILAKYPTILKGYQLPITIKAMHAFSACATFSLTAAALVTALQTNYFAKLTKDTLPIWQLAYAVPPLMVITVVYQVVQSYGSRLRKN